MAKTKPSRGTLSPELGNALSNLAERGKALFSVEDFARAMGRPRKEVWRPLTFLVDRGWVVRLMKGQYLIVPLEAGPKATWTEDSLLVGSHLAEPSAVAYWSACHYWDWTEQVPRTVFVQTTQRTWKKSRDIQGVRYRFVLVRKGKFFGTVRRRAQRGEITVTDREKTLVDCMDHPELCGGVGQVLAMLPQAEGLDWDRVDDCLERMDSGAVYKRLGWLVEHLGDRFKVPDRRKRIDAWQSKLTGGDAPLEPGGPQTGPGDSRWRVRLNVPGVLSNRGRR